MEKRKYKFTCVHCGLESASSQPHTKYCSTACYASRRTGNYHKDDHPEMNQRDLGAWSELLASADLMKRGYDVLRAVSQSCPCDIVAFKDDKDLMRIQVRTGSYNPTGMATAMVAQKDASKFDVLAIVMKDGKVFYEPNVFQEDNSMVNPATAASVVKYAKPERAP
jgi:Holliday junction resolvase-like predicted endonuclease